MAAPALERRAQLAPLIPEAFSERQFDMSALKRAFGGEARVEPGLQDTRGSEAILT